MADTNTSANINETLSYLAIIRAQMLQQTIVLSVIMILTFVGNVTIIIVLLKQHKSNKQLPPTNMFVLNLAFGDLGVCCICMTTELLDSIYWEWLLGNILCKMAKYAQTFTLTSSVLLILGMSYDRYIAICQPMKFANNSSRAKRMIIGAWILASILGIPQIFIFVETQKGIRFNGKPIYYCESSGYTAKWQREVYLIWQTFVIFILPIIFISYCYINVARVIWKQGNENITVKLPSKTKKHPNDYCGCAHCFLSRKNKQNKNELVGENNSESPRLKNNSTTESVSKPSNYEEISLRRIDQRSEKYSNAKIRSVKLTLFIIVSFIGCWTPYFIVNNIRVLSNYRLLNDKQTNFTIKMIVNNIAMLNSALNPFIYGCFSLNLSRNLCHRTPVRNRTSTTCTQQESTRNASQMTALADSSIEEKPIISEDNVSEV